MKWYYEEIFNEYFQQSDNKRNRINKRFHKIKRNKESIFLRNEMLIYLETGKGAYIYIRSVTLREVEGKNNNIIFQNMMLLHISTTGNSCLYIILTLN